MKLAKISLNVKFSSMLMAHIKTDPAAPATDAAHRASVKNFVQKPLKLFFTSKPTQPQMLMILMMIMPRKTHRPWTPHLEPARQILFKNL